ncbi:flagellar export chaperone FliS [Bacillus shivajii]|uniref:flagellar export chaperone FliS n=1 Tax=Bacillus shivajii TaxID=1983719 RepID=UPI001CFB499B|nr:flagellar export chaperone FliS [Bacillus shivajii]UCZ54645.1 flagellar export chaperone FliS [Bacillus shivajii]
MISNEALHKKTSQEITALLYEALLDNLEEAKQAIVDKDYVLSNEKMQKANDILHRLGAGINYEAGIIADQLDALYNYMAGRIIQANFKKDEAILDEVITTLQEISSSWQNAMKKNVDNQPKMMKQKASAYEKNVMFE